MTNLTKNLFRSVFLLGILFTTACGAPKADSAENKTVKLGVVGEVNEPWDYVKEQLAKKDITLEIIKFSDYATPNTALAEGELDLNAFQTKIFLDAFNKDRDENLTAIGNTVIAPLGIYSSDLKDINEVKKSDTVAIPNDVSNEGRALLLLQTAGLIKVDPSKGQIPVIADITSNPLNLQFEALDSAQTARALDDVAISVINSGMAVDAGFIPTKDAIFLEPVTESSDPYFNVIAARGDDKDKEIYQEIVKAYQTDETKKIIEESSKGSSIAVWK